MVNNLWDRTVSLKSECRDIAHEACRRCTERIKNRTKNRWVLLLRGTHARRETLMQESRAM
jgi:hypothetical protein